MQLLRRGFPWGKLPGPLPQLDHRIQGAVLVIGRATALKRDMRDLCHVLCEHLHQARFANAGLTLHQDDLPQPLRDLRPALPQQRHFGLPSHQGRPAMGRRHLQATLGRPLAQDAIHRDRRVHPLEDLRAQVFAPDIALDQAQGVSAHHHRVGFRQPLQPRRQIRRVSQGQAFMPPSTAHLPHNHQAGVDSHAHGELDVPLSLQPGIELPHRLQHRQAGVDRPPGVVLVRLGIAKVDQEPIPEILRDIAVKALDHRGTGVLVRSHHLALVFRVKPPGQAGRVDQITEQYGELAAFGVRRRRTGEASPCGEATADVAAGGTGEAVVGALDGPPVQTRTLPSSSTASCLA